MTLDEKQIVKALHLNVTYLPGHYDKIFARDMYGKMNSNPYYELSKKQREFMYKMLHKYRKQISAVYRNYHPDNKQKLFK